MKKIYTFNAVLMNGTVTMQSVVQACASRELAERVREVVEDANRNRPELRGFGFYCSDVEEVDLMETEEDAPILKQVKPRANPNIPPVILSIPKED